ncbi:MAG TPA: orotate phosphoribosyltransferase [Candidatus Binataceae bacterium]|nr:orotate phosphoribosyltransferase [Candidatus Binataceae bacterium]
MMNAEYHSELLEILVRESYVERAVTLSSGKKSDYYLDCRRAIFLPRAAFLVGELILELALEAGVEQLGGMAVAAIPVTDAAIAAAYRRGVNLRGFFVRKETKAHGLQQRIEGAFQPGLKTAVLDDTITTGGSTLEALAAVRDAGATVTAALTLVDRGEGGAAAFAREGLKYRWVVTGDEIRSAAKTRG